MWRESNCVSAGERAAPPVSLPQKPESWGLWVKTNASFLHLMEWTADDPVEFFLKTSMTYVPHVSLFPVLFFSTSGFMKREWCFGSHVILPEHNCRCLSLAVFFFPLKEALVSRATGNGRTTSLFSTAASPPLSTASLPLCLSLALCRSVFSGWIR